MMRRPKIWSETAKSSFSGFVLVLFSVFLLGASLKTEAATVSFLEPAYSGSEGSGTISVEVVVAGLRMGEIRVASQALTAQP